MQMGGEYTQRAILSGKLKQALSEASKQTSASTIERAHYTTPEIGLDRIQDSSPVHKCEE